MRRSFFVSVAKASIPHRRAARALGAAVVTGALVGCGAPSPPTEEDVIAAALAFLREHPELSHADGADDFEATGVVADEDGGRHVRFTRRFYGLPVIGGDGVVHGRLTTFRDVTLTLSAPLSVITSPKLTPSDAVERSSAFLSTGGEAPLTPRPHPPLVVWARTAAPALAYDVVHEGIVEEWVPSRLHVIVDARSGDVLDRWDDVHRHPGQAHTLYLGGVPVNTTATGSGYTLVDPDRGNTTTLDALNTEGYALTYVYDPDNVWGDGTIYNRKSVTTDVFFGMEAAWDYYASTFGRYGVAGNGVGLPSIAHFGNNFLNAFFNPDCMCVSFGSPLGYYNGTLLGPMTTLDVVGHEVTHAVTYLTAGLVYSGESGALNESTSDIFGTMVEFFVGAPNDPPDWYMGEQMQVGKDPESSGFGRNLAWPETIPPSVGCYEPNVGQLDVHFSSGIGNHFFHLLAEGSGGRTHTCGTGVEVTGIGRDAAQRVWYRALTVYMTSNTDYHQAREATLRAAADLFGDGAERNQVDLAWRAVRIPYDGSPDPTLGGSYGGLTADASPEEPGCFGPSECTSCLADSCAAESAACFGPAWQSGAMTGPCADYVACFCGCSGNQAECSAECAPLRGPTCESCLSEFSACATSACGATCGG